MAEEADELEQMVTRAAALADKLPEKYQQKAFELLLQSFMGGTQEETLKAELPEESGAVRAKAPFVMPITLRALFEQYHIPEESLRELFVIEGDNVVPKYSLKAKKLARAQIQIATLVALENALKGGKLEFNIEEVRQRCIDLKAYHGTNFMLYFSRQAKLFKSLKDPAHVELTTDGKAELAQTVAELTQ